MELKSNTRGFAIAALAGAVGIISCITPAWPGDAVGVALKSYKLSMTREELKVLPPPKAANWSAGAKAPALLCSDDKVVAARRSDFYDLALSREMLAGGVVRCAFYMKFTSYGSVFYQIVSIRIANGPTALVSFYFTPSKVSERAGAKLFVIAAACSTEDYNSIRAALVEKYGAPTSTDNAPFVNQLGGQLDNEIVRWVLGDAVIAATMRDGYVRNASIVYTDQPLLQQADEVVKAAAKKAADDL